MKTSAELERARLEEHLQVEKRVRLLEEEVGRLRGKVRKLEQAQKKGAPKGEPESQKEPVTKRFTRVIFPTSV